MREAANRERIRKLMTGLGQRCADPVNVYFTGGATAVLFEWRADSIDVDLKVIPDSDAFFRAIPFLKEELDINIELACPSDFIPELPGWQDRSIFIEKAGSIGFFHYDPYSQTLAKIERGHSQDVEDVRSIFKTGLVQPDRLLQLFKSIEDSLYRYPAIDPPSFRQAVEIAVRNQMF